MCVIHALSPFPQKKPTHIPISPISLTVKRIVLKNTARRWHSLMGTVKQRSSMLFASRYSKSTSRHIYSFDDKKVKNGLTQLNRPMGYGKTTAFVTDGLDSTENKKERGRGLEKWHLHFSSLVKTSL